MDFNSNITKEQNRKSFRSSKLFTWWHKNSYIVARIVFFPIWAYVVCVEKYKDHKYKSLVFSEETCRKYLNKLFPKLIAYYDEDPYCFTIVDCDSFGYITFNDLCGICSSYLESRRCKKEVAFTRKFSREVKDYIINKYEIPGYTKITMTNYSEWEAAKDKFGWYSVPYRADYCKGVVFYVL